MRFALEVNEKQAELMMEALDLYIRIRIGQWNKAAEICMQHECDLAAEDYCEREEKMRSLIGEARGICFPELGRDLCGSYGVGKFDDTRAAYDVFQVLRHELSWARHPKGAWTVDFDKPTPFSDLPMPVCEKLKD